MSGGVLLFLLPGLHSLRLKSPPCALCRQVDIFAGSYALGLKRFPVYFFRIKPVFRLFRRFFRIADGNDCYGEHRFRHTELFTQVVNEMCIRDRCGEVYCRYVCRCTGAGQAFRPYRTKEFCRHCRNAGTVLPESVNPALLRIS